MRIIAHRGLWDIRADANTAGAFLAAAKLQFDIETDFRDFNGQLVVSHDPPMPHHNLIDARELNHLHSTYGIGIAINVKADGLQAMMHDALDEGLLERSFIFDASIPDLFNYVNNGFRCYSRLSEEEPSLGFESQVAGVWLDSFYNTDPDLGLVRKFIDSGKEVSFVSPELHGKPNKSFWEKVRIFANEPGVSICTDFPVEARNYFGVRSD